MDTPQPATILSLDRGNSTLDCLLSGPNLHRRQRLSTRGEPLGPFLAGVCPDLAVGMTVVQGGLETAAAMLESLGCPLSVAGEELPCPLALCYPSRELGVDRWVAALAAQRRYGDALVVDCGTALTLDLVTAAGQFLGGMIAAGMAAQRRGLADTAPGLPQPEPGSLPDLPAGNTRDAISAGTNHGYLCMLDGLVDRLVASSGLTSPTLVLTGGDAAFVAMHSRHRFVHRPELTHEGLRCLLNATESSS